MISRNYTNEAVKENPHKVDVRSLYNDPSAQVVHITLQPGEQLKPHKTPVDVVFYVLEGSPTIHIGDEEESFAKDTLIESPAYVTHHISNKGIETARVLVIKAPRPDKATAVL